MIGVGLDFGTTNSTIAVFDGQEVSYLEIDPLSLTPSVMTSALYFDREFSTTIGAAAIQKYLTENEGRRVRLVQEILGEVKISYGELGMWDVEYHANVDRELPGQLFRGLKKWLGYQQLDLVRVLDKEYQTQALITPILEHIKTSAEEELGTRLDSIHVGRPIQFEGPDDTANKVAVGRLSRACAAAGLTGVRFYPEPLGATLSYIHSREIPGENLILTFDFGGGTLDLCLILRDGTEFEILATHGVPVGGDKMDQEIYRYKLFPELGKGAMLRTPQISSIKKAPFRFFNFTRDLLDWHNTFRLNTYENMKLIDRGIAIADEDVAEKLRRLKALILQNGSFSVFQAIEVAKITLSDEEEVMIEIPEIDILTEFNRRELEEAILIIINQASAAVDTVLEMARIQPEEVNLVVRTGGSSQIAIVRFLLEEKFPGRVVEYDVFQSIAAGLAIANYHGYEFDASSIHIPTP
jgi:hypothetical chaperone protein